MYQHNKRDRALAPGGSADTLHAAPLATKAHHSSPRVHASVLLRGAPPPPPLPYKEDTSRPSLRTNWTRLADSRIALRHSEDNNGPATILSARCSVGYGLASVVREASRDLWIGC